VQTADTIAQHADVNQSVARLVESPGRAQYEPLQWSYDIKHE